MNKTLTVKPVLNSVDVLLNLMEKYHPHLEGLKTRRQAWLDLMEEYNSVVGTSHGNPEKLRLKFKTTVGCYKEDGTIWVKSKTVPLLKKLTNEYYTKGTHHIDLALYFQLFDKYKPFSKTPRQGQHPWKPIMDEYNSRHGIHITVASYLREKMTIMIRKLSKDYQNGYMSKINCKDEDLIKRVFDQFNKAYQKPKPILGKILLNLMDKYKPHLQPVRKKNLAWDLYWKNIILLLGQM